MKIAVLGAGAMGSLFGGYLSKNNDVWVVDVNEILVDVINREGIRIVEESGEIRFRPHCVSGSDDLETMDLIILFVKAMYSREALKNNQHLIGENTYVMTLQNGAGHEQVIEEFVSRERIIIGTTQHNSSIREPGFINHGGGGLTYIGLLDGGSSRLRFIAENFTGCGFETATSDDVKAFIWKKLFVNVSASIVSAVLQSSLDYLAVDDDAWWLTETLVRETVAVANADGLGFDPEQAVADVKNLVANARNGYTSIYADLRDGRKTEVDTISGFVVNEARRLGVPAPSHDFIVSLCHAMENHNAKNLSQDRE